jgi:hypothetical protein
MKTFLHVNVDDEYCLNKNTILGKFALSDLNTLVQVKAEYEYFSKKILGLKNSFTLKIKIIANKINCFLDPLSKSFWCHKFGLFKEKYAFAISSSEQFISC